VSSRLARLRDPVYGEGMEVAFDDSKLALVETEDAALTELPVSVIRWLRTQLCLIRAAPDERTLRNWKSLGYDEGEALFGRGKSVSVPPNWRLYFRLDEARPLPTFVVVSLTPAQ